MKTPEVASPQQTEITKATTTSPRFSSVLYRGRFWSYAHLGLVTGYLLVSEVTLIAGFCFQDKQNSLGIQNAGKVMAAASFIALLPLGLFAGYCTFHEWKEQKVLGWMQWLKWQEKELEAFKNEKIKLF